MKPLGLISQIGVIGLAILIVTLFVRPTFTEIGELQNEVQTYSVERERVTETNRVLSSRVYELESIAVGDRERLSTYIPALLDEVAVLRDIEIIAQNAGVDYSEIQYLGEKANSSEEARLSQVEELPVAQEFSVNVIGSYGNLKDFFSMLEQNEYPLQAHTLQISSLDAGFLSAEVVLVTYITSAGSVAE